MRAATLRALAAGARLRIPLVLATRLKDGCEVLSSDPSIPPGLAVIMSRVDRTTRSLIATFSDDEWLLQSFAPSPRLVIVGAVHVAQILSPMARLAGFDVIIVDPRAHFASEDRFPDTRIVVSWPDTQDARALVDRDTAVVTLSHDPRIDDPAIETALQADCFYIGSLGSKRSHAARLGRLRDKGLADEAIGRIRGPVGLPLGSSAAADIAISILAELVAVRQNAPIVFSRSQES